MRLILRRPPLLAALALTAGLAGALVLLTVLDAAILRPIPAVAAPERLISIAQPSLSYPALADFDAAVRTPDSGLEGVAGYAHRFFAVTLPSAGASGVTDERLAGVVVAGDYFGLLGARAAVGRLLSSSDDRPGAAPAVVLAHGLWRDRFGGDPRILDRELRLNGSTFRVVGVAEAAFRGLARDRRPMLWVAAHAWADHAPTAYANLPFDGRSWSWLRAFGRLAPGADAAGGRARLVAEAQRQMAVYPKETRDNFDELVVTSTALAAIGVRDPAIAETISSTIAVLVGLLLTLAIASAAGIFLARAEARRTELATRLALGADRRRMLATLLAEPLLATTLAVVAAIAVAGGVLDLLAEQILPGGVRLGDLGLAVSRPVALGGALLALLSGLLAGWLPARRLLAREHLAGALGSARALTRGSARLRRILTAAQVTVALVLVAATALATRALGRAAALDTGFAGERLGFVALDAGLARLDLERARSTYDAVLAAVTALPAVETASLTSEVPLDPDANSESFRIAGYEPAPGEAPEVEVVLVGPGALSVLGIPLRGGREIESGDRPASDPVAVISVSFAARYLAGREALGAEVELVGRAVRVVGVADDAQTNAPGAPLVPTVYLPLAQAGPGYALQPITLVYRARPGADPAPAVQRAIAAAAPGVPVIPIGTFASLLATALAPQRFASALFGTFSLIALALAAIGLFGLVSHVAAARLRELGLRSALGATPRRLLATLLGTALAPCLAGGALGVSAAIGVAAAGRGLVVGLEHFDLGALAIAVALLGATAALACAIPAARGARLDPAEALRSE